ncbi:MAG: hypothetical protein QOF89_196 [Acidobacteriota bacterium]|jgi:chromosome segregation and condensation protein ScpB|nr:hypothetical protein [Acidobacteriota bacterium]
MSDVEVKGKIIAAINDSKYKWRTAQGIAKSSGIEVGEVMEYLGTADTIVQARNTNTKGEPLFTTTDKYRKSTGLASRVLSAITNKVAE